MKLADKTEPELRAWLLDRMRAEVPAGDESRHESPDDYVYVMHHKSTDAAFRSRIEAATLGALEEAARGCQDVDADARAVIHLSWLVDQLELVAAAPILQAIAERGEMGGHVSGLYHDTEEVVLFALAGVQAPKVLYEKWAALWARGDLARIWEVIAAGMRISDPERALELVPLAAERALIPLDPPFDLGAALWGFYVEDRIAPSCFLGALAALPAEARNRCEAALAKMDVE